MSYELQMDSQGFTLLLYLAYELEMEDLFPHLEGDMVKISRVMILCTSVQREKAAPERTTPEIQNAA